MNLGLSELLFLAAILALCVMGTSFAKLGVKYLERRRIEEKKEKKKKSKKLLQ